MGKHFLSLPPCTDRLWGRPSLLIQGVPGALSPGVKRPQHEADNSPPFVAEVKNGWSCISLEETFVKWAVTVNQRVVSQTGCSIASTSNTKLNLETHFKT